MSYNRWALGGADDPRSAAVRRSAAGEGQAMARPGHGRRTRHLPLLPEDHLRGGRHRRHGRRDRHRQASARAVAVVDRARGADRPNHRRALQPFVPAGYVAVRDVWLRAGRHARTPECVRRQSRRALTLCRDDRTAGVAVAVRPRQVRGRGVGGPPDRNRHVRALSERATGRHPGRDRDHAARVQHRGGTLPRSRARCDRPSSRRFSWSCWSGH